MERGAYTVSVPSVMYAEEADYFGITTGRDVNKFQATGLTPTRSDLVDAPYVDEFPMILECKLLHHFEIGLHTQFVGEILDVKVDVDKLAENGSPDINQIDPFVYATKARDYYRVGDKIAKAFQAGNKYK